MVVCLAEGSLLGLCPWAVGSKLVKGVRKHWEALKDHWVLDYRAVPQVRSPGLWYGHSQAQCHTGQGCSGPQGSGSPSCGWDKGPAKANRA